MQGWGLPVGEYITYCKWKNHGVTRPFRNHKYVEHINSEGEDLVTIYVNY